MTAYAHDSKAIDALKVIFSRMEPDSPIRMIFAQMAGESPLREPVGTEEIADAAAAFLDRHAHTHYRTPGDFWRALSEKEKNAIAHCADQQTQERIDRRTLFRRTGAFIVGKLPLLVAAITAAFTLGSVAKFVEAGGLGLTTLQEGSEPNAPDRSEPIAAALEAGYTRGKIAVGAGITYVLLRIAAEIGQHAGDKSQTLAALKEADEQIRKAVGLGKRVHGGGGTHARI